MHRSRQSKHPHRLRHLRGTATVQTNKQASVNKIRQFQLVCTPNCSNSPLLTALLVVCRIIIALVVVVAAFLRRLLLALALLLAASCWCLGGGLW